MSELVTQWAKGVDGAPALIVYCPRCSAANEVTKWGVVICRSFNGGYIYGVGCVECRLSFLVAANPTERRAGQVNIGGRVKDSRDFVMRLFTMGEMGEDEDRRRALEQRLSENPEFRKRVEELVKSLALRPKRRGPSRG